MKRNVGPTNNTNKEGKKTKYNFYPLTMKQMDNWILGRSSGCSGKRENFFEESKQANWHMPLTSLLNNLNYLQQNQGKDHKVRSWTKMMQQWCLGC